MKKNQKTTTNKKMMNTMKNKRSSIVLLAAALLMLGVLSGCSSSDGEAKNKDSQGNGQSDSGSKKPAIPKMTVRVAVRKTARPSPVVSLHEGPAFHDPVCPRRAGSFLPGGPVCESRQLRKKLYVDIGSEVREGQLLATMEAPRYKVSWLRLYRGRRPRRRSILRTRPAMTGW
jgi:hypothetical protein